MLGTPRSECLAEIAKRIIALSPGHPVRVAVDGRTASGKSTLGDNLAALIVALGRPVIRSSIDGFHRTAAERHKRGRFSAEGYYRDARDLKAVRELLLGPLGPGGDLRYATASFDLAADTPLSTDLRQAEPEAVLVFDGTFVQRRELRTMFDFVLFVDVPEAVARARAIARESAAGTDAAVAAELYDRRYAPAFDLYCTEMDPVASADAVLDNRDFDRPALRFGRG